MSTPYHEHYPTPDSLGVVIQSRANPFANQQTGTFYENASPAFSAAHKQEIQEDEFRSQVLRMFHELESKVRHRELTQVEAAKEMKLSVPSYIALRKSNRPSLQLIRRWFPQLDCPKATKEALASIATSKAVREALHERQDVAEATKLIEAAIKHMERLPSKVNESTVDALKDLCSVEMDLPEPTASLHPLAMIHTVSQRAATQVVDTLRPRMERVVAANPRLKPWLASKKTNLDTETGLPAPSLEEEIAGLSAGSLRALFTGNQLRQQPNAGQLYYLPASKRTVIHTAAAFLAAAYHEGHDSAEVPAEAVFHAVMEDRHLFKRTGTYFPMAITQQAQAELYELTDPHLTEVRKQGAENKAYEETPTAYLATNFARALSSNSMRIRTASASEVAQIAMLFGVHPHSLAIGQMQWVAQMGAFSSLGARKVGSYAQMLAVWSSGGNKQTERLLEEAWMARWAAPYRMAVKSDFNTAWRTEDYHKILGVFIKVGMKYQLGQITLRNALGTLAQTADMVRALAAETGIDCLVYPSAAGSTTIPNAVSLFQNGSELPWVATEIKYCKELPSSIFGSSRPNTDVLSLYREPEDLAIDGDSEEYQSPVEALDSELKGLINKVKPHPMAVQKPSQSPTATSVMQESGKNKPAASVTSATSDDWDLDNEAEEDKGSFFSEEGHNDRKAGKHKVSMPNIRGADGSEEPVTSDFD